MTINPKISFGIVMPTYQRVDLLARAVESVQNQSHKHWKLVIIDDSDDDNTQKWVQSQAFDAQKIIYLKNKRNSGVCFSRNQGIDALILTVSRDKSVDFLVFLDDDDFFAPDCLENAAKAINRQPDYAWFISRKLFSHNNQSLTRVNVAAADYHYVDDCLIGSKFRRDATHFIRATALADIRFDDSIKLGGEWRFFAALADNGHRFVFFEGGITYVELQNEGLTAVVLKNLPYKVSERVALLQYINSCGKFPLKQAEFSVSVVRHYVNLGEAAKNQAFIDWSGTHSAFWLVILLRFERRLLTFLKKLKH